MTMITYLSLYNWKADCLQLISVKHLTDGIHLQHCCSSMLFYDSNTHVS